ncbi:MAG: hypothetical protein AB8B91_01975, partial [Rubripirellula sp.]
MDVRFRNAHVSTGLADIISNCLAPLREDRYQDASELMEDLNRHRKHRTLLYAPNRSTSERLKKWSIRHPRLASVLTVSSFAAVLLLVAVAMLVQRDRRIATLAADTKYQQFQSDLPNSIAALSTPGRETEILNDALTQSSRLLDGWVDPTTKYCTMTSGIEHLDQ